MKRLSAVGVTVLVGALCASAPTSAQESSTVRLQPGLWRHVSKSSQDGRPLSDSTETRCYTAEEFDNPVKTFVEPLQHDQRCTVQHTLAGRTLTMTLVCKPPAAGSQGLGGTAESTIVFVDTRHFTRSMRMVLSRPNWRTEIRGTLEAEYIGECPN